MKYLALEEQVLVTLREHGPMNLPELVNDMALSPVRLQIALRWLENDRRAEETAPGVWKAVHA